MIWIILIVVAIIILIIGMYNSLVSQRMQVKNAWSQIDVQIKRRHDLIPNLVEAVKGYMKYEKEALTQVIEARAKAFNARDKEDLKEIGKAEGELSEFLARLFALFERYPELKANQNVMMLQEELSNTENKIAFARQFYNDMVMKYNTSIQVFPKNIIAGIFGFKPFDFLIIEKPQEKEAPGVDLNV
jgi:LemA protein